MKCPKCGYEIPEYDDDDEEDFHNLYKQALKDSLMLDSKVKPYG